MTSEPLVTVIMPVYNREESVARAIDSVLAQTYHHWEFLVTDDGSTDGTRDILSRYEPRITVLSQSNAGAYAARNLALRNARGEYIAFIDSDDAWRPLRLEAQLPLFTRPEIGLVFGNAALVDTSSGTPRPLGKTFFDLFQPYRGNVMSALACENFIPQSSILARRDCFDRLGGFSLASRITADYAKWSQIALHYEMDYVPECVFEYAFHQGNISQAALRSYFAPVRLFHELLEQASGSKQQEHLRRQAVFFEWNQSIFLIREGMLGLRRAARGPDPTRFKPGFATRLGWVAGFLQYKVRRRFRRRNWTC